LAFILLKTQAKKYPDIIPLARRLPEILECHHVSGGESFVIKSVVSSIPHLEDLIEKLSPFGETSTLIVLSSPVDKRALDLGDRDG
jgi:Lrp/AsnC family leucine-responsive transcriptional regulator